MNRRDFLKRLAGAAAAIALAPVVKAVDLFAPRYEFVTLDLHDEFCVRYLEPAVKALREEFDRRTLAAYLETRV